MYLKSLELQGFKSFPDKIRLTFDQGLTAVVGPNGSGKSNIGDAVRWVLGEQSTKTLRGNKMEDVIFSGTVARKPVGFAAVTLTIDNADGVLGEDAEISITRRLYRSGESEYQINGRNVRLKDINELFMDTGLGRDGYSIIGQGRIAEIVGAKSNERRDIFEEAAGISKFRYKKQEAEHKLAAAQDNLLRLHDIVSELESRVEPLRVQSAKAEKFLTLAEERKQLEVSVWSSKLTGLRARLDDLEEQTLVSNAAYENLQSDIEREEQKIAEAYTKMQESTLAVERQQARILEIEQASAQKKADIAVCENEISHSEASIAGLREQQAAETLSKTELTDRIAAQGKILSELQQSELQLTAEIAVQEEKLSAQEQSAADAGRDLDSAGTAINGLYLKRSELRFTAEAAEQTLAELAASLQGATDTRAEQAAVLEKHQQDAAALRQQITEAAEEEAAQNNRLSGYQRLYQGKASKLAAQREALDSAVLALKEKQQRQRILQDLENSMEGFGRSVKEILRAGKSGRLSGVRGSVAQLIRVEAQYGLAIETALGGAMQNLVVENEEIAKRGIRYLKEQRAGRATFLPMTAIKGNLLQEQRLSEEEGFVALAVELVQFDPAYTGIFRSLLGRIAVAEDIDTAAVIAKKYGYKFRIVTLDGQVINAGGSFTGGSAAHASGVITRRNELDTLASALQQLEASVSAKKQETEQLRAETEKLRFDLEAAREACAAAAAAKVRLEAELGTQQSLAEAMQQQQDNQAKQYAAMEERRQQQTDLLAQTGAALEALAAQIQEAEQSLAMEQGKREQLQTAREQLSARIAELRMKHMACGKDMEAAQREMDLCRDTMARSAARDAELEAAIRMEEQKITAKRAEVQRLSGSLTDSRGQTDACRAEIAAMQTQHIAQQQRITQLQEGVRAINDAKEKRAGERMRLEERQLATQKEYDDIIRQLLETYEMTRSEAEQYAKPLEDLQAAQRQLAELKNKIRGLGNVNVGAIEEYREVSERYQFLSGQIADVTAAKRELEKLIEELTADMCRIFSESFTQINANFKAVFTDLFGGGRAELILTDPEHVLESGIEISVAPPGKVIKNLIALSGGEQAFVAICIYFAILKLRPAPFCILDEIDAALDEANVRKYAQYLRHFTDKTQFVLVTHRRSAMEEANVLYGVTMQEDGISRLLRMEQVDEAAAYEDAAQ